MKESENSRIYATENFECDYNPLKHEETHHLNDTMCEVKNGYDQRNHNAFDDFSAKIENGSIDSQRQEDKDGFSDAACLSSYDHTEKGSKSLDDEILATEFTNESKDLHFTNNGYLNPFLDPCDLDYTDKNVVKSDSYHVVKDICVDMGIPEQEKTDIDDAWVNNGYKSTNPFLEPEDGKEDTCEHTAKGVDDTDDFMTPSDDDRISSIIGNECKRSTDQVTLSHQISDERQASEGSKASSTTVEQALPDEGDTKTNRVLDTEQVQAITILEEETTTENVQELSLVTEEDATNDKESSNDHRQTAQIHCDDETREKIKEANLDQVQVRNASNQNRSELQHDEGETSFSRASLVEYSGPMIAYSGSISHRSDASTTSGRSFAFPILQSEWDTSPVRMAKADKRHYRKHNGWRLGLLCCRF